jgi:RimJ/RimL family protein N-acetyltransferase
MCDQVTRNAPSSLGQFRRTSILATERIILRPYVASDIDISIAQMTDPEVMKYIGVSVPEDEVLDTSVNRTKRSQCGCLGTWVIVNGNTQEKLGTAILLPLPISSYARDWSLLDGPKMEQDDIEIGYVLQAFCLGARLCPRSCKLFIEFCVPVNHAHYCLGRHRRKITLRHNTFSRR